MYLFIKYTIHTVYKCYFRYFSCFGSYSSFSIVLKNRIFSLQYLHTMYFIYIVIWLLLKFLWEPEQNIPSLFVISFVLKITLKGEWPFWCMNRRDNTKQGQLSFVRGKSFNLPLNIGYKTEVLIQLKSLEHHNIWFWTEKLPHIKLLKFFFFLDFQLCFEFLYKFYTHVLQGLKLKVMKDAWLPLFMS